MTPQVSNGTAVLHDPATGRWLHFERPHHVVFARRPDEVIPLLERLEREVESRGWHAVGFVAYEAASAFDPALQTRVCADFPLAWFGLYDAPKTLESLPFSAQGIQLPDWSFPAEAGPHTTAVDKIKALILSGDTYQVNFSLRLRCGFNDDCWSLFAHLVQGQGSHYAAFINTEDWCICSASPELFFRLNGVELVSRPMKGTAARGLWPAQDQQQGAELLRSEKNRAENVMIVDMVRNDLGRIARPGSIRVDRLFELERYPTLWQLTSSVRAETDASPAAIFKALFPAASITGAPKVRTMQIIADLETTPRGVYTGAIGFIAPQRQAQFNVAIRTVLVDKAAATAEYGVGGGIVWDSAPDQEFEECRLKARVLAPAVPEFALLETMLWAPASGFSLLEAHLGRLAASAQFFGRTVSLAGIRERLRELERTLPAKPTRVRVTVARSGEIRVEAQALPLQPLPCRLGLAREPISAREPLLYHKTTHRRIYDQALAACPDCDDVLLWNEQGELTESTIGNVVVEKEGRLLTPPLECGLLPGTYRAMLLEQGRAQESVIRMSEVPACSRIYLANSVRGLWEAVLAPAEREWLGLRFPAPPTRAAPGS
jgi:para-aminobenzoate synthetase/4-amino-4-deoxychorismate lyase